MYYNDNEPFSVKWLNELQNRGLIPTGRIDDRSIAAIRPEDTSPTSHFFAGIGGWPLALQLAGWDPARPVWSGSCPCQPFSIAGKNSGFASALADDRHLWPTWYGLIKECKPPVIFGEQTASKLGRQWLAGVRSDLEALGYAVGAADLCAAGVNAPHRRQRLYWVAYAGHGGDRRWDGFRDSTESPKGTPGTGQTGSQGGQGSGRLWTLDDVANGGPISDETDLLDNSVRGGTKYANTEAEQGSNGSQYGVPRETGPSDRGLGYASGRRGQDNELRAGWDESGIRGEVNLREFWDDFNIAQCRAIDGSIQYRRIKPGVYPVANGIPNRVGRIRGYGNSIVPQLAAVFIKSFMEAEGDQ